MNEQGIRVTALDHLVLRCCDVESTLAWYTDVLGLEPVRVTQWRDGSAPFPSVRVDSRTIIDLVEGSSGSEEVDGRLDHICLVIDDVDLDNLAASGGFVVVDGPADRFGARGMGRSLYVRDPEGTIVELRCYGIP